MKAHVQGLEPPDRSVSKHAGHVCWLLPVGAPACSSAALPKHRCNVSTTPRSTAPSLTRPAHVHTLQHVPSSTRHFPALMAWARPSALHASTPATTKLLRRAPSKLTPQASATAHVRTTIKLSLSRNCKSVSTHQTLCTMPARGQHLSHCTCRRTEEKDPNGCAGLEPGQSCDMPTPCSCWANFGKPRAALVSSARMTAERVRVTNFVPLATSSAHATLLRPRPSHAASRCQVYVHVDLCPTCESCTEDSQQAWTGDTASKLHINELPRNSQSSTTLWVAASRCAAASMRAATVSRLDGTPWTRRKAICALIPSKAAPVEPTWKESSSRRTQICGVSSASRPACVHHAVISASASSTEPPPPRMTAHARKIDDHTASPIGNASMVLPCAADCKTSSPQKHRNDRCRNASASSRRPC